MIGVLAALLLVGPVLVGPVLVGPGESVREPAADSPEAAVLEVIEAALARDLNRYLDVLHPMLTPTEQARTARKSAEWPRLVKQVRWYVAAERPLAIIIDRRVETDNGGMVLYVRDIANSARGPVPVRLAQVGDVWRVLTHAL
ncbi:MAG: hypothetical protein ACI9WU_002526 [Myxococcota bacterium]|jgi:hypothetical protein